MTDFRAWSHESLARYAIEASERIKALEEANEQLRSDLRDSMVLLRDALGDKQ